MNSDRDLDTLFGIYDEKTTFKTESEQEKMTRYFAEANASLALEGLIVPEETLAIQRRVAAGELTSDEAVALITEKHTQYKSTSQT